MAQPTFWMLLALLVCLNVLAMWGISRSKKWKRLTRPSAAPLGVIVLVSPFIDQPRIAPVALCHTAGVAAAVVGFSLCILALREFRRYGLTIKALVRKEFRKPDAGRETIGPHVLVASGPYRLVRHPQMLGFVIFYVGYSLFFRATYALCLVPLAVAATCVIASMEERQLEEQFGREYEEYREKSGMFLPRVLKR